MVAMLRWTEQPGGFPREAISTGRSTREWLCLTSDKERVSLGSESSCDPALPSTEYFLKTNHPIGRPPGHVYPLDRKPTPGHSSQSPIRQERIRFAVRERRFPFLSALNHRRTISQFLCLTARGLTSKMCTSRKRNNGYIFTRPLFSKTFRPRAPALSAPEPIFMEIFPLREYFPGSSSPCTRLESSPGPEDCLPGRVMPPPTLRGMEYLSKNTTMWYSKKERYFEGPAATNQPALPADD